MNENIKVERLTATDFDEWLYVINRVFTIQNGKDMDFRVELPQMCICDDEHMGRHFAVKKNGKIVSVLGVYPLPMKVVNEEILFSTVGNIATIPEEEGNGYMTMLLNVAMKELNNICADASRLSGDRMRYNCYGYEYAGFLYNFTIKKSHIMRKFHEFKSDISFVSVKETDDNLIYKMKEIYKTEKTFVKRDSNWYFFKTLCGWGNLPYVAIKDGTVVGYISVSEERNHIAEISAITNEIFREILLQWIITNNADTVYVEIMPYKSIKIRIVSEMCADCSITNPSMFKILNWEKVVDAFFKLKVQYTTVTDGELIVEIENYGKILLKADNNDVSCTKTDLNPHLTLTDIQATRLFFGIYPENSVCDFSHPFLPLPLSWNLQDRV